MLNENTFQFIAGVWGGGLPNGGVWGVPQLPTNIESINQMMPTVSSKASEASPTPVITGRSNPTETWAFTYDGDVNMTCYTATLVTSHAA